MSFVMLESIFEEMLKNYNIEYTYCTRFNDKRFERHPELKRTIQPFRVIIANHNKRIGYIFSEEQEEATKRVMEYEKIPVDEFRLLLN